MPDLTTIIKKSTPAEIAAASYSIPSREKKMNTNKQYRKLKAGEIVHADDEYIGVFSNGKYIPVKATTVGQPLLPCNVKYYRRPIMSDMKIIKK